MTKRKSQPIEKCRIKSKCETCSQEYTKPVGSRAYRCPDCTIQAVYYNWDHIVSNVIPLPDIR